MLLQIDEPPKHADAIGRTIMQVAYLPEIRGTLKIVSDVKNLYLHGSCGPADGLTEVFTVSEDLTMNVFTISQLWIGICQYWLLDYVIPMPSQQEASTSDSTME